MSKSESKLHGAVARLTAMRAGDDATETYQDWAPDYETDLLGHYGYQAHHIATRALVQQLGNNHVRIADLGCGTGLVAESLREHGYVNVDGFDASANMLAEAEKKQCYQRLVHVDLTDTSALPTAEYDAAIAVGVFGPGHIGPENLHCFFQPVVSGGVVALYANGLPFVEDDYPAYLQALEREGICRLIRVEESNYMDAIERPGWLVLATRL